MSGYLHHHLKEIPETPEMTTETKMIRIKWEVPWMNFLNRISKPINQEAEVEDEVIGVVRTTSKEEKTNTSDITKAKWTKSKTRKECKNSDLNQ